MAYGKAVLSPGRNPRDLLSLGSLLLRSHHSRLQTEGSERIVLRSKPRCFGSLEASVQAGALLKDPFTSRVCLASSDVAVSRQRDALLALEQSLNDQVNPGDWIEGPFWEAPVQIVTLRELQSHDRVTINAPYLDQSRAYVLTPGDWDQIRRVGRADYRDISFTGDPTRFRLGINAHRLRLSHAVDPYAALNASRIDPLPHQFEAVYEHLLARPVVRALLAHDAGAGKTMADVPSPWLGW